MIQIAIDGPAGAGKSTVAKTVAQALGFNYMDTGAMYRAVAYAAIKMGIDPKDAKKVKKILKDIDILVEYRQGEQHVLCGGQDVTPYIRTPAVSKGSSDVAVIPEVRLKLVKIQRDTAKKYDIVMDGRDIGTYVLPEADVKFFITASVVERAKRRAKDLAKIGVRSRPKELEKEILARDKNDSERKFAPLAQAKDAILLDTSDITAEQAAEIVLARVKEVCEGRVLQDC